MAYMTHKEILCTETGKTVQVGDTVTIKTVNGGGSGGCRITKITDTGFHFNNGGKRDKVERYENISEIY